MQTTFKVGDKVRIKSKSIGPCDYNDFLKFTDHAEVGEVCGFASCYRIMVRAGNDITDWQFLEQDLELIDIWQQGDIIFHKNGNECKILGVCGDAIFTSKNNDFEKGDDRYHTQNELEHLGWKLKTPEDELIEVIGKKYNRKAVEERLKELKPIED